VEKVKLTKLPMACLIASTTHQDKEWSIIEFQEVPKVHSKIKKPPPVALGW
jgi:hypothetical protein